MEGIVLDCCYLLHPHTSTQHTCIQCMYIIKYVIRKWKSETTTKTKKIKMCVFNAQHKFMYAFCFLLFAFSPSSAFVLFFVLHILYIIHGVLSARHTTIRLHNTAVAPVAHIASFVRSCLRGCCFRVAVIVNLSTASCWYARAKRLPLAL